jgi:hypothetical protein
MRTKRTKNPNRNAAKCSGAARRVHAVAPFFALIAAFSLVVSFAIADEKATSSMKGFRSPLEYFEAPYQLKVKSFLESSEAENAPNGMLVLRNAKLRTFHNDGTVEMIAMAPYCVYDTAQKTISSAGPLQVQTSQEGLSVWHQGVGFLWTNADLRISNEVSTVITGAATNLFTP